MAPPVTPPSPQLWRRLLIGRDPRRTLVRAAVLVVVAFVTFKFLLLPVRIQGVSMEPTYRDGSVNLVNRLAFRLRAPRRGDVVAVKTSGFHVMYLKRIVGMPGETIAITNGIVTVNRQPLAEPYVRFREPWNLAPVALDADQYLVIGDNRGMEERAHWFDAVKRDKLAGPVLW